MVSVISAGSEFSSPMLTGTARGILCMWIIDAREYKKYAIRHSWCLWK